MLGRRTDLALEAKEIWEEGAAEAAVLEGVEAASGEREGFHTETGEFGAYMQVDSLNDGPLTIILDTDTL